MNEIEKKVAKELSIKFNNLLKRSLKRRYHYKKAWNGVTLICKKENKAYSIYTLSREGMLKKDGKKLIHIKDGGELIKKLVRKRVYY